MPVLTPINKVNATRNYGAKVVLHGEFFDDALAKAQEIAAQDQLTLIHPFDDLKVIQGQATIGLEIAQELSQIDYCLIPVGGGGLASGIASYLKQVSPRTKIVGVEAENVNSLNQALQVGKPSVLDLYLRWPKASLSKRSVEKLGKLLNLTLTRLLKWPKPKF